MTAAEIISIGAREIGEDEPVTTGARRPIRFFSDGPSEPTSEQRMRIVEASGTLDFWDRPEEDIYSLEDGEPV